MGCMACATPVIWRCASGKGKISILWGNNKGLSWLNSYSSRSVESLNRRELAEPIWRWTHGDKSRLILRWSFNQANSTFDWGASVLRKDKRSFGLWTCMDPRSLNCRGHSGIVISRGHIRTLRKRWHNFLAEKPLVRTDSLTPYGCPTNLRVFRNKAKSGPDLLSRLISKWSESLVCEFSLDEKTCPSHDKIKRLFFITVPIEESIRTNLRRVNIPLKLSAKGSRTAYYTNEEKGDTV